MRSKEFEESNLSVFKKTIVSIETLSTKDLNETYSSYTRNLLNSSIGKKFDIDKIIPVYHGASYCLITSNDHKSFSELSFIFVFMLLLL